MSSPAPWRQAAPSSDPDASLGRRSLAAFLISGILLSFLGAILPAWHYHLKATFTEVGGYFLCLNLGILASVAVAYFLLPREGARFVLVLGNALASSGFLFLAFTPPSADTWWRWIGVFWIGVSAGLLNAATFQAISTLYQHDRAATVNMAGVLFGLGCLATAVLVAVPITSTTCRVF